MKVFAARGAHKTALGIAIFSFKDQSTSGRERQEIVSFHLSQLYGAFLNCADIPRGQRSEVESGQKI